MSTVNHALKNDNKDFDVFKYNQYMALYPFNDKKAFKQWLAINHLTHDAFLALFDKSYKTKIDTENCPWMDFLLNEYHPAKDVKDKYNNQFGVFIDFIVEKATTKFSKNILKLKKRKELDSHTFISIFSNDLTYSLLEIITPTLTLELNVVRVKGSLSGETSKIRYKQYIELLLSQEYVLNIFKEYPLLWEKLIVAAENHLSQSIEFYTRIIRDIHELNKTFGTLGGFLGFTGEKGDDHNSGRAVKVCCFENLKIVYKPRCLDIDTIFHKLLEDLNIDANTSFCTFKVINRTGYGWTEYISYKDCNNTEETKAYYSNLGHYMALFYILNSSDYHCENIRAHGKYPVLIDLETIFHIDTIESYKLKSLFNKKIIKSNNVLTCGVLPSKSKMIDASTFFDVSVLGYRNNQNFIKKHGSLKNMCKDNMELVRNELFESTQTNLSLPSFSLNDMEISSCLCQGFENLYKFFQSNPSWLLNNKHFKQLTNQMFRAVFRPTSIYNNLVKDLNHPDLLRSTTDRNLYMQQKLWCFIKFHPQYKHLVSSEFKSICNNNIPIFSFKPNSMKVYVNKKFLCNGLQKFTIKDKLTYINKHLSDPDLKIQLWLIKSSMLTKNPPIQALGFKLKKSDTITPTSLIHYTTKKLLSLSFFGRESLNWANFTHLNDTNWNIKLNSDLELYNGNLGTLLYLTYYSKIFKKDNLIKNINHSITNICNQKLAINSLSLGGHIGIGGVLYSLSKIYQITKNSNIPKFVNYLVLNIDENISNDEVFDILYGASGCILGLIEAYKTFNNISYIKKAQICANQLLKKSMDLNSGVAWPCKIDNKTTFLGGFSHGATGIGYSLLKLSKLSNNSEYKKVALKAFEYEDSLFNEETCNYSDLRTDTKNCDHNRSMSAWCHGNLGIALARLDLLINKSIFEKEEKYKAEIPLHIKTILKSGLGHNHSLCHGDAGSLEYLYQVSTYYPDFFSKNELTQLIQKILLNLNSKGLINGTPFNIFTPGLFTGSIGLAYQLMRISNNNIVGNVLLLN